MTRRGKFGFYGYGSTRAGAARFGRMLRKIAKRDGYGTVQVKVRKVSRGIHRGEFEVAIRKRRHR